MICCSCESTTFQTQHISDPPLNSHVRFQAFVFGTVKKGHASKGVLSIIVCIRKKGKSKGIHISSREEPSKMVSAVAFCYNLSYSQKQAA